MADQKNIDQFFQKKLKDFEQEPRPEVWLQIEERLTKKKKRRVLPMWWYGAAAAVLIGLLLFPFSTDNPDDIDPVQIKEPVITNVPVEVDPSKNTSTTKKNSTPTEVIKNVPALEVLPEVLTKENEVVAKNTNTETPKDIKAPITYVKDAERGLPSYTRIANLSPNEIERFDLIRFKGSLSTVSQMMYQNKPTTTVSLFDAVKKNDSLFEKEDNLKRGWGISPSYGYIKTNSFASSGSSIDQSLNNNPVGGNDNASFGVNLHFPISKNWGIRSGIHIQNLSYSTGDIGIASGVSSNGFSSVRSSSTGGFTNDIYIGSLENTRAITALVPTVNLVTENAIILQRYGYIEFPVELTYSLRPTDNFSIGVISGFSTLLLNDNEILVQSEQYNSLLGEANNLNPLNVSVNFGFDLDYVIYKNWSLNVNPMVKVPLKTFTQNSNGFSPYFVGVYTGVKYQF